MKPLRFFYIPNETAEGDQIGPRKAFEKLEADGILSAYQTHSFLVERKKVKTQTEALDALLKAVEAFGPDVIFWQHLNASYPLDREFLRRMKSGKTKPKFVWHDPDAYGRFIKRIDNVMKAALAECDLAVIKGLGNFSQDVRRAGARRILFAPESFDDVRFCKPWQPTLTRRFDAVMIANLTCLKRIPFLYMPGGRNRKVLAESFYRVYGARYAVFGSGLGWKDKPYCQGSIKFEDQESTMRQSWLSINWSQFDKIPMYFSDRLPIGLASGIPQITNYQRGFEHLFPGAKGIFFVHSPAEALDVADMLLSKPREHLIEIGEQGVSYALENLNATRVYRDIVTAIQQQLFSDV